MKYIYVVIAEPADRVVNAVKRLCQCLKERDVKILMDEKHRFVYQNPGFSNIQYIDEEDQAMIRKCEVILSVGGDGTVLRAASVAARADIPLAGINTGKIGFLAKISESIPDEMISKILNKEYPETKQMTLDAGWGHGNIRTALNDITLSRIYSGRMCTFRIYCDDEEVAVWRADGIIIFTPTGSTAYAYSTGSPAIDPALQVIGITPICPQNGRNNGLICQNNRKIRIVTSGDQVMVSADGKGVGYLLKNEPMDVICGKKNIRFLQIDQKWRIQELNRALNHLED